MGIVPPQAWEDDSYQGRLGYIKATADVVNPIADQENMIAQSGGGGKWVTRVLEGSGHSPMLSRPTEVARAVDSLIQDFQKNTV
jgi:pimeloyl-ACP methyl ester carboxylesterase